MYSPGYVEENKTKPKITLKIEESDGGVKPDQAAEALLQGIMSLNWFLFVLLIPLLLQGVQSGHFHISADLIGNLFRSSTLGATPHNNVLMDIIYGLIGWVRCSIRLFLVVSR